MRTCKALSTSRTGCIRIQPSFALSKLAAYTGGPDANQLSTQVANGKPAFAPGLLGLSRTATGDYGPRHTVTVASRKSLLALHRHRIAFVARKLGRGCENKGVNVQRKNVALTFGSI
jgi:hypothetical protein